MPTKNFKRDIKNELNNIQTHEKLTPHNKELIQEFYRDLRIMDYSEARILKLLNTTKIIGEIMNTNFDEATKNDIKDLVAEINSKNYAESTKRTYKVIIRRFYKWLNNEEDYPDTVNWIELKYNKTKKLPEKILTEQDIHKLLEAATHPRTKALISILWETGARIGELIDLTIGHIEEHPYGKKITIDGKTGQRRLPLIQTVPHLRTWIDIHPNPQNKQPLWVNIGNPRHGQKCTYRNLSKSLQTTKQKTDINKPVNPHHFRHSRATYLANKFTDAQMCEWFGWVQGSDMPARYIHLSGRDIDGAYAQIHGIKTKNNTEKSKLAPQKCPTCTNTNPHNANACNYCGKALNQEALKKLEKAEKQQKQQNNKNELIQMIQNYEQNGKIHPKLIQQLTKK
ncbi:site-specific integrase [Methanonatronarchaeum sp. AMET-Sl]|uniref:site-specific integrase n=1 Tax=Methanonatronarchaeum sp. AMET-Sl TaxID=3037654 RepID=UPI00244DC38B|nr:site-specific integrase [Methanonatronarchaeum sp. AMET-Sl]WGI17123.1 site-specific integrase [Methanonatronarchaeum sp. AMET-Sl]WGI17976.1 site-specific integrase [Methanonatronarchaeum sp. AMET-Sl]